MTRKLELLGERFGRLTVIASSESVKGSAFWSCKCDCGKTTTVSSYSLRHGKTESCGCLQRELVSLRRTSHGLTGHRLYRVYGGMMQRCFNEADIGFKNYGGRGITVCDRWLESFENFYSDMIMGYSSGLQLDRKDNDGNYAPENCRWVTKQQNSFNRRKRCDSASSYKGVYRLKGTDKWRVYIAKGGKSHYLGTFSDEVLAARVYDSAAKELFGEFANLNLEDLQVSKQSVVD